MIKVKISFDMDGTLADFYSCPDWLTCLEKGYTKPYREAKTLVHGRALANRINALQALGVIVEVISWSAKSDTEDYFSRVKRAKEAWLKKHYPQINWDAVNVVRYGYKKERFTADAFVNILFDDNAEIRQDWESNGKNKSIAYSEKEIINRLDKILNELMEAQE